LEMPAWLQLLLRFLALEIIFLTNVALLLNSVDEKT
jgi:hypothetical protein